MQEEDFPERSYMDRKRKKQKHVGIGEFLKNPFPEEILMNKLRRNPYRSGPQTRNEVQQFMDLMVQNAREFPTKLRSAIATAKTLAENFDEDSDNDESSGDGVRPETKAEYFLQKVQVAALAFVFGFPIPPNLNFGTVDSSLLDPGWYGPNIDVDTPDQIELAIRIFPITLRTKQILDARDLIWTTLPAFFLTSAKAVPFFPMLADLYTEYGRSDDFDIVDLSCELLDNTCRNRRYFKENTLELHEVSLAALLHLREKGFLHGNDGENLEILERFLCRAFFSNKSASFIERRLRHLIEWEPDILVVSCMYNESYLMIHLYDENKDNTGRKLERRLYEFVLEQGALHYPKHVLGFGLHGQNLNLACQIFGTKEVDEVVNDKIKHALKQSNNKSTIQEWVLKAAMDNLISLDGLYTLIRFDPSAVMNITKKHIDSVDIIGHFEFTSYCRDEI